MTETAGLKNLEAYILGVIGQFQPCTPYRAMKFFLDSPSVYYSGSAGAIYPAIKRLEGKGLLKSVAGCTRGKKSRLYSLTPRGMKKFTAWFEDPGLIADGGFDPVRGRISLISVFREKNRQEQMENLYRAVSDRLARMDDIKSRYDGSHPFSQSIEMERETLRAKAALLKRWLKKGG